MLECMILFLFLAVTYFLARQYITSMQIIFTQKSIQVKEQKKVVEVDCEILKTHLNPWDKFSTI